MDAKAHLRATSDAQIKHPLASSLAGVRRESAERLLGSRNLKPKAVRDALGCREMGFVSVVQPTWLTPPTNHKTRHSLHT